MSETQQEELSKVAYARLASGLTLDDAATITGMSLDTYREAEDRPLQLTLGELRALCAEFNSDGRRIMVEWFNTFFGL